MITITIPDERPMSWNAFYSGMHYRERTAEAKRVHGLVRTYCVSQGHQAGDTLKYPVKLIMKVYFKNRPLDASNIAVKLYEDGLKGWLLADDSMEYVRSVEAIPLVDKLDPRVELILEEVL